MKRNEKVHIDELPEEEDSLKVISKDGMALANQQKDQQAAEESTFTATVEYLFTSEAGEEHKDTAQLKIRGKTADGGFSIMPTDD